MDYLLHLGHPSEPALLLVSYYPRLLLLLYHNEPRLPQHDHLLYVPVVDLRNGHAVTDLDQSARKSWWFRLGVGHWSLMGNAHTRKAQRAGAVFTLITGSSTSLTWPSGAP